MNLGIRSFRDIKGGYQRPQLDASGAAGHMSALDADVAGHGGQCNGRPVVLLTGGTAAGRPTCPQGRRPAGCILPCEHSDVLFRSTGDFFRPLGCFGHAIRLSHHIGFKFFKAACIFYDKRVIIEIFGYHDIGHGDQHGSVGARFDGNPLFRQRFGR